MKRIIYIFFLAALPFSGFSQTLDSLIRMVEKYNPSLIALSNWIEAERVKSRTGIFPDNPEINFSYLWGRPDVIGNQNEFELMQTFRVPGYYKSKSAVKHLQFEQNIAIAEKEKKAILHNVRSTYFNLVWLKKKAAQLNWRKQETEKLVTLLTLAFERGEISLRVLEKSRIHDLGAQNEWRKTLTETKIHEENLRMLVGGREISGFNFEYPINWVLPPLDSLIALLPNQNPDLLLAELGVSESENIIRHEKMNSFPVFGAGYRSEAILNQKLHGFQARITIPLWENRNRIKQANLQKNWAQSSHRHVQGEIQTSLINLYNSVQTLYENHVQIKSILGDEQFSENSLGLLHAGQISFPEYLIEVVLMNEFWETFLINERDYYLKLSELKQFVLFN